MSISLRSYLWPAPLIAVLYAIVGGLSIWLASPPGYAAPLFPAAGLAMAVALTYGRKALPGILLGAWMVDTGTSLLGGQPLWSALLSGGTIAVGATAQAAVGRALLRRALGDEPDLASAKASLILFALGGGVACVTSASVATLVLWLAGTLTPANALWNFLSWWLGDALGVMVATPITLTVIGRPRALWTRRRVTVALPMLAVAAAVSVATLLLDQAVSERARSAFEREANIAAESLERGLRQPLAALQAMQSLYLGSSDDVTDTEFKLASQAWLDSAPSLQAIGFSVRAPRGQLDRITELIRQQDGRPWRVFNRADAPPGLTAGDTDVVAILRVEPQNGNSAAMGVNVLSIPAAREAILRTERTGHPAASAGFRLTQSTSDETGVVIYQAVRTSPANPTQPTRGVVFVTLRVDAAARALLASTTAHLSWCLTDRTPGASRPVLAGAEHCPAPDNADTMTLRRAIDFGGRRWELSLYAPRSQYPQEGRWALALFAISGLMSTALLGMLLLSITGHSQRVEAAVMARTIDLRREIVDRQRAEGALRDSEQRWHSIVDHIPIGVVYADMQGLIVETNPRLCDMLGLDAARLVGTRLDDLVCPEDRPGHAELLRGLRSATQPPVQRRQRLVRGDGSLIWVQGTFGLLADHAGQPLRITGVIEDITEHLRLADAERARESAEAASRAKSEFLSRISHELRTPLNAVLGFSQLLSMDRDPALSARQTEWVDQVQRAGWHLLNLINEMMDLSRIEAGELRLELQPTDPVTLLQDCMAMVRPTAEARSIQLLPPYVPHPVKVLADGMRLRQILTNLLSNAVKYNRERGGVHCSVRELPGNLCEITVRDEGAGLQPEELERLFQPFNRLGRERSGIEGTGLGLVISRRLAEAMGGQLRADSTPGLGSTFRLKLPRAPQAPAPLPSASDTDAIGNELKAYRRVRRLVYIEDNAVNAEVMRGILASRPQIALDIATNATAGLAAIRAQTPDLILLDMHLPDMDGLDVLRALSADPGTEHIPVLAVSADATPDRIKQAFELGAADYATKPVDVPTFLAQVDLLLERPSGWMSGFAQLSR